MCPAPDVLLAFTAGELSEARALEIETHIDDCAECRAVLSSIARGGPPPSLGRYRIDTVLGSGGMGIVYRGFDPQLARPVAIKVVRRGGEDTAGRARLVREAQSLARLSHPNVCHVYDVGTHDDEVWVAMELIDGVHLRQWSEEGRTQDEIMSALLGAAEGISAAHAAGLVHRDIKPENVLVTRDGRAIVTDFGLARHEDVVDVNAPTMASDPQLTATGAIAGTPAYLAPEQLLGDPIDARVDQFAWAVMAWELFTASRPFPIVFAVRVEAIRAGLNLPPKVAPHIGAALVKALSASPSDRFASMRELIDAVRASPPAADRRARTPLVPVRGRGAAIAGLVVLGGAAIAVTQWPRSEPPPSTQTAAAAPQPQPQPQQPQPPPPSVPADAAVVEAPAPAPGPAPAPAPRPAAAAAPAVADAPARIPSTRPRPIKAPPAAPPDAGVQQITTHEPQGPVIPVQPQPAPPRFKYNRGAQIATVDAFCLIPTDFEKPGTKSNYGVLDWGTVTKIEPEAGTFGGDAFTEAIITMRGQRKMYRFTSEFLATRVDTTVGAKLAVCAEGDSDIYKFSGGPTDRTRAVITLSAPPNILPAARLGAKHVPEIQLAATSLRKTLERSRITEDGRYLVRAEVLGVDGNRYRMDRYILEVPRGMKNEDLLEPKKHVWMVVEKPRFDDTDDGGKILVVKAALILGELFP